MSLRLKSTCIISCVHSNPDSYTGVFKWKTPSGLALYNEVHQKNVHTLFSRLIQKKSRKIWPVTPSRLSHMPRICLSIYTNRLLLLILKGLRVARGRIIPRIKGLCMGLDQNYFPTGIVKMISAILCNLFCHIYGNNLGSIITWASEGLL